MTHTHTQQQPISTDARVVGDLVVIHLFLAGLNKPVLLPVGPNTAGSSDALLEMRVNGRTTDRLHTFQLS